MSTRLEQSDNFTLAKEIYNAINVQKRKIDEYLPYFIESIIEYHKNPNLHRETCIWGCFELDEKSSDGWYDGTFCPTCGYVRGMNG